MSSPVNPGCFRSFDPPNAGDCTSRDSHFFVQAIVPNLELEHRVTAFLFWSNDGKTLFPAAGVLVSSFDTGQGIRLPSPEELGALQAKQVSSGFDTAQVHVDLVDADLRVPAGDGVVLFAVVQFPSEGKLTQVGEGPGVLVDTSLPDQDCDFFSLDGGSTWRIPVYVPGDPLSEPLDWGFEIVLEPTTSVQTVTWSHLKRRYRTP